MTMSKFSKYSVALPPSVPLNTHSLCFHGEEDGQGWWAWHRQVWVDQVGVTHGSRQPSLQVLPIVFYLQGCIPRGLYHVGDGLPWDWVPDAFEGTWWQDQDVLDFVQGSSLAYFEHHLMRRLEAKDSEVPDNKLIELTLRHIGLEYIPKRVIRVQKYYMRRPRGSYIGFNTSVQNL
jgi:hypothetical protein